jgi:hypothetical protein
MPSTKSVKLRPPPPIWKKRWPLFVRRRNFSFLWLWAHASHVFVFAVNSRCRFRLAGRLGRLRRGTTQHCLWRSVPSLTVSVAQTKPLWQQILEAEKAERQREMLDRAIKRGSMGAAFGVGEK